MFFQKKIILHLFFALAWVCTIPYANSQKGFTLNKKKDRIPFEFVNNLVIIPVSVNGTELSFLLDTGVSNTIIFGVSNKDSLDIFNTSPIKVRGLGQEGSIEALKSESNELKLGDAIDSDHTVYFIFDNSVNLSSRMGVPIHGILGSKFFENFVVETNYIKQYVTFYDNNQYKPKNCKKCETFDLTFYKNKPYLNLQIELDSINKDVMLLVDSGSSDAIWLFEEDGLLRDDPKNYFDDFLGLGLSGNIYGKRSRIKEVTLGKYNLKEVSVAIPEKEYVVSARIFKKRNGSIGGAFLKRFITTFNYKDQKLTLKKNSDFYNTFNYDMSGLTIEHGEMEIVRRTKKKLSNLQYGSKNKESSTHSSSDISVITEFEYILAPKFVVVDVRKNSPAFIAGIEKGNEILYINGKPSHYWKLYELTNLFASKEGRKINLEIKKNNTLRKIKFSLKKVL